MRTSVFIYYGCELCADIRWVSRHEVYGGIQPMVAIKAHQANMVRLTWVYHDRWTELWFVAALRRPTGTGRSKIGHVGN